MRDNYLVHGTNAMKGALRYISGPDFAYEPRSVQVYMAAACSSLGFLLEDGEALEQITSGIRERNHRMFHRFEDFIEEFIKPDRALMVAAGMDEDMANYLFNDLNHIRRVMREMSSDRNTIADVRWLRTRLEHLRESACSKDLFGKNNSSLQASRLIRQLTKVLGGGAIVTTNVLADSLIGGVISAFSQGYGGHLVMKGIEG
ncbi:hypothetical protein [Thiococcus pfennigii]|uniref:hypothetical protein n=1 Tax=Thiococcus pfennigii TaxID=1057 RepID=UPI001907C14A|nr:hypothetical protein [Thiococcus pfennigii]MBK1699996.1 hypothetical protein [Thiococcus pfennigii]